MLIWGKVAFFPSARWWADIGYWLPPQNHNRKCREKKGIGTTKESTHRPTETMRMLQKEGRLFWIAVTAGGAAGGVVPQPPQVKHTDPLPASHHQDPQISMTQTLSEDSKYSGFHFHTALKLASRCLPLLLTAGKAQCLRFLWGLQVKTAPALSGT